MNKLDMDAHTFDGAVFLKLLALANLSNQRLSQKIAALPEHAWRSHGSIRVVFSRAINGNGRVPRTVFDAALDVISEELDQPTLDAAARRYVVNALHYLRTDVVHREAIILTPVPSVAWNAPKLFGWLDELAVLEQKAEAAGADLFATRVTVAKARVMELSEAMAALDDKAEQDAALSWAASLAVCRKKMDDAEKTWRKIAEK